MFRDRNDAGRQLARALESYRGRNPLVLAIPHGGVRVGYEVAKSLGAEFSILVVRKLPFPQNPEAGFGAIAEDGSTVILREHTPYLSEVVIQRIIEEQKREIDRRVRVLRGGATLPGITNRLVLLIDDGIAMGSTMTAAVRFCRKNRAAEIVVATPVASLDAKRRFARLVDGVVVLDVPPGFRAVAQVYENWYDLDDWEVLEILERWHREEDARKSGGAP